MAYQHDPEHPTGVSDVEGTTDNQRGDIENARKRKADAVLEMRLQGYSFEDCAEVLGYPDARACQTAYEKALQHNLNNDPQMRTKMRDLAGRRLDRLLRAVMDKALDEDNAEQMVAHQRALAVVDRHIKLYGLDAPSEHIVHTPTASEIDKWVAEAVRYKHGEIEEDDIFDADYEEVGELEEAG